MQRGDQIVIRRELNQLGKTIAGVLSGEVIYSPLKMGAVLFSVGLGPSALVAVASLIASMVYLSPTGRLVMRKLYKGEMYYEHHGIFKGNNMVIHEPGQLFSMGRTKISSVNLDEFSKNTLAGLPLFNDGHSIQVFNRNAAQFSRRDILRRAHAMLNREIYHPDAPQQIGYDLIHRNCEHFANWCRTGEWRSFQLEDNGIYNASGGAL